MKAIALTAGLAVSIAGGAWADAPMSRGEYLYKLSGCENCHTDREHDGARLGGGRKLETPLGVFYTPNITPDKDTGIGRWSEADFIRALREGKRPDGANYYPSFPYTSYTRLSDADMKALWGYLRAVPAVRQADEPHELPWYLRWRPLLTFWKWLYFDAGAYQPVAAKTAQWNRGAYLVQGAAHCGECHTPRNLLGGYRKGYLLAGTMTGPEGAVVPNITPDKQFGIGRWKRPELVQYLSSGIRTDGDCAGSLMAEIIDNGLKYLPPGDLEAIAAYVAEVPAVANPVHKAKKAKKPKDDSGY
ncbi:MAG: cytochrome c [Gallionellaceae bacterium]|nr:cytochrome c [Gallionellaceae bacterium]